MDAMTRQILHQCSVVCSFDKNLPEKSFRNKDIYNVLEHIINEGSRDTLIKETLLNMLYLEWK